MPRGTLEVIEFDPRKVASTAAPSSPSSADSRGHLGTLNHLRLKYPAATSVFAALTVLALHALVLAQVLSGGSSTGHPEQLGSPNTINAMLIDDRPSTAITIPAISQPRLRTLTVNLPEPPDRGKGSPGLAALYGRYLGQVHARIDRAWLRPREAIGAELFRCQVEIRQEHDGTVEAIALQTCNGTAHWQHSLVEAIEAASPLPAHPGSVAFTNRMLLHFRAVAYKPGQPAEAYEPARPHLTNQDQLPTLLTRLRTLRRPAKRAGTAPSIELRINGSHMDIEPHK